MKKKMFKKVTAAILAACLMLSLTACGGNDTQDSGTPAADAGTTDTDSTPAADAGTDNSGDTAADPTNGELVDGKFLETRHISVEVYDRGNDGGSDPTNNMYTQWIQQQMLEKHNVEVEFVAVPRWTEVEQINNLLAAGNAPDICLTYDYPTIQTYANMGGVLDLSSYVDDYRSVLPNMWNWLTETNIYWDKSPTTGELWAIETKLATTNRINTFVRKDWLDALGLSEPTTKQEFEDMLIAFRDNADTLLGADADKMIPYSVSFDVGWRAATLIESFIDPNISDYEYYINGFDDRKYTENGTKEAVRLLNKWYNDGLMWDDFALYGSGDTTEDDMMKAGYVGAFTHNWDYPYRNGEDSILANLKRLVGEDATYVVVDPFEDSKGTHTKFVSGPIDRKIFFPSTNDEPLACLLYIDFISEPETIQYLQLGDEGVTHNVLDDGAVEVIAATGDAIQNSGFNIDLTITCNGLNLIDPEQTAKSIAHSYASVDPALVEDANKVAQTDIRIGKNVNVGAIEAEEGMGPQLSDLRDRAYDLSVSAPADQFDAVWDQNMDAYLGAGGQAIIDERIEKWQATFGNTDSLPE